MPRVVLDGPKIERAITQMAERLAQRRMDAPWAVVGIRRGGELLARRLAAVLHAETGVSPAMGTVDITLYRDDGFGPHDWPVVGPTEIPFDLSAHTVILVDDVLYTGRTVRAAIDAILDYGRPRAVRLAVLVDRGLRELPIGADAVGLVLETRADEHVDVRLESNTGGEDLVVVGESNDGRRAGE